MISEKMRQLTANSSVTRAMFEEGVKLAQKYGAENVYDFSLGNPSVPAPTAVGDAIVTILERKDSLKIHGYMSNAGFESVRQAVAENLNRRFSADFSAGNIIMTVGAGGGLNVILKTLLNPGDEVLTFAPYFNEYGNYVANYDGVLKVVPPDTKTFQPDPGAFAAHITPKTRAVIINNPNNPTGVVYTGETCTELACILREKQAAYGAPIYLISDEPYRELVYDGVTVPFLPQYYENTIVVYSWSKSLSLPGERIGYLAVPNTCDDVALICDAAAIVTRVSGFVNAPSLMQLAVAECLEEQTDVAAYDKNRLDLWNGLTSYGFTCVPPQGAFYLFVKSPTPDDGEFVERAKKYRILMVPGSSYACPGYVRVAYCVRHETILRALPYFKALAGEYGL